MKEKQPAVYILASNKNGTMYTGVTSDLIRRVWQHKNNLVEGFTKKYNVHLLVWYEIHESMESAISKESRLKVGNEIGKSTQSKRKILTGLIYIPVLYSLSKPVVILAHAKIHV